MPLMRLTYSGTDIDFQSLHGSIIPNDLNSVSHISKDGTLWTATRFEVMQWEPIARLVGSDAANINTWTQERYTCTFTPDRASPATTYQVKILNRALPMQRVSDDGPTYQGQLLVRRTSA
jgi:hypothetical protein